MSFTLLCMLSNYSSTPPNSSSLLFLSKSLPWDWRKGDTLSLIFFAYISDGFELLLLVLFVTLRGEIAYLRGWIVDFCLASRLVTTILGLAATIVDLFLLGRMVPGADVFLEVDSYSFPIEFFTFCQNMLSSSLSFLGKVSSYLELLDLTGLMSTFSSVYSPLDLSLCLICLEGL